MIIARIYAQTINGNILHYRDSRGLECDAIVHLEDGRWAPIEVKLGGENLIEEGAGNLLRLKSDIAEKYQPSFMMILTFGFVLKSFDYSRKNLEDEMKPRRLSDFIIS